MTCTPTCTYTQFDSFEIFLIPAAVQEGYRMRKKSPAKYLLNTKYIDKDQI